jgi:hypothetical protein
MAGIYTDGTNPFWTTPSKPGYKLSPQGQPAKDGGIDPGLPPGGELGDETGMGNLHGGEGQAAGIALVDVKAEQAEMDDGWRREGCAKMDGIAKDAGLIVILGRRGGEGPTLDEGANLDIGG